MVSSPGKEKVKSAPATVMLNITPGKAGSWDSNLGFSPRQSANLCVEKATATGLFAQGVRAGLSNSHLLPFPQFMLQQTDKQTKKQTSFWGPEEQLGGRVLAALGEDWS